MLLFFFQAEDGIRDVAVTGVQTCALPISFADTRSVAAALRSAVEQVGPSLPPISIQTMSGLVSDTLETDRFIEQLSGAFGLLAILLASVGLYGVMAYIVARRTRDIGIRMALGARPANVLWQGVRGSFFVVLVGIEIGRASCRERV